MIIKSTLECKINAVKNILKFILGLGLKIIMKTIVFTFLCLLVENSFAVRS